VIGNGTYQKVPTLPNPPMRVTLAPPGAAQFCRQAGDAEMAVVFFANFR
jgi:hypothetical protein